jgi:hypothetical protein
MKLSGITLAQLKAQGYTIPYTFTGEETMSWMQGWNDGHIQGINAGAFYDRHGGTIAAGTQALMKDATHGVIVVCLNKFELAGPVDIATEQADDLEGDNQPPPQRHRVARRPPPPEYDDDDYDEPPPPRHHRHEPAPEPQKKGIGVWNVVVPVLTGVGGYAIGRAQGRGSNNRAIANATNNVRIINRRVVRRPTPTGSSKGSGTVIPVP